jgi:hypothetical protein
MSDRIRYINTCVTKKRYEQTCRTRVNTHARARPSERGFCVMRKKSLRITRRRIYTYIYVYRLRMVEDVRAVLNYVRRPREYNNIETNLEKK